MNPARGSFEPALFLSTFGLIFLSELPDKTAFATTLMAARRHPVAVFAGVTAAFLVQTAVAVLFGSLLNLFSPQWVRVGAGVLFLFFAWKMWNQVEEEPVEGVEGWRASSFTHAATSSFLVIFLAEWGDLSQLATAALVAKHGRPLTIFLGAAAALISVSALAVALGHNLKGRIHPEKLSKVAAVLFAIVGLYFLLSSHGA
ncbi:MAG: TMEM165/GDT1 family protein [Elusimicrobia bacterium]|nr:TMEM165/GDT1 family protein [Elusimicrobiota bacterium]MDE2510401.1 TMEM165/GDT1 family protein [Elusimicrobiota bacterium]